MFHTKCYFDSIEPAHISECILTWRNKFLTDIITDYFFTEDHDREVNNIITYAKKRDRDNPLIKQLEVIIEDKSGKNSHTIVRHVTVNINAYGDEHTVSRIGIPPKETILEALHTWILEGVI